MDPAATLSAPSAASILATVGVQDGLLAVRGVMKASGFVTPFQAPFRLPNNLLLTLMKGDEVVEFVEHLPNNNLLGPVMGHMNNYVCELFELQNLCVFGVSLRRSLVLDEQLGSS